MSPLGATGVSDRIADACAAGCRRAVEAVALAVLLGPACALAVGLLDSPDASVAAFSLGARRLGLLGKSALLATAVSLSSTTIAVIAASMLARVRRTTASVLKSLFLVLAAVPPGVVDQYVEAVVFLRQLRGHVPDLPE